MRNTTIASTLLAALTMCTPLLTSALDIQGLFLGGVPVHTPGMPAALAEAYNNTSWGNPSGIGFGSVATNPLSYIKQVTTNTGSQTNQLWDCLKGAGVMTGSVPNMDAVGACKDKFVSSIGVPVNPSFTPGMPTLLQPPHPAHAAAQKLQECVKAAAGTSGAMNTDAFAACKTTFMNTVGQGDSNTGAPQLSQILNNAASSLPVDIKECLARAGITTNVDVPPAVDPTLITKCRIEAMNVVFGASGSNASTTVPKPPFAWTTASTTPKGPNLEALEMFRSCLHTAFGGTNSGTSTVPVDTNKIQVCKDALLAKLGITASTTSGQAGTYRTAVEALRACLQTAGIGTGNVDVTKIKTCHDTFHTAIGMPVGNATTTPPRTIPADIQAKIKVLQDKIQELLRQITQLQAQIGARTSGNAL